MVLGVDGTNAFSDRVLRGTMADDDRAGFTLKEAEELFLATTRPDPKLPPEKWSTAALDRIKRKVSKTKEETRDEGETTQTGDDRDISLRISPKDFIQLFRRWQESTSLSYSGRHIEHYRAILGDEDLVQFFCTTCELPLNFGFSPVRWEKTCTLMLEKSPAHGPRLDKLRVIHLLEADYNFVLKLIWGR